MYFCAFEVLYKEKMKFKIKNEALQQVLEKKE